MSPTPTFQCFTCGDHRYEGVDHVCYVREKMWSQVVLLQADQPPKESYHALDPPQPVQSPSDAPREDGTCDYDD